MTVEIVNGRALVYVSLKDAPVSKTLIRDMEIAFDVDDQNQVVGVELILPIEIKEE